MATKNQATYLKSLLWQIPQYRSGDDYINSALSSLLGLTQSQKRGIGALEAIEKYTTAGEASDLIDKFKK